MVRVRTTVVRNVATLVLVTERTTVFTSVNMMWVVRVTIVLVVSVVGCRTRMVLVEREVTVQVAVLVETKVIVVVEALIAQHPSQGHEGMAV